VDADPSDDDLLAQARAGRADAAARLFDRRRERLRRAIRLRLDRRVAARVDASDVLQETYLEAVRRLPDYLERPSLPFDLWLLWLAREQVLQCHRRHLGADKRTAGREVGELPAEASGVFVAAVAGGPSPSGAAAAAEAAGRLRLALARLDDDERELILWRHFEQLGNREAAQLLGVSEAAASKRYVRALERLRGLLLGLGLSGFP
jgi:RNA polymerase sigma-70 factor (ECF subfamily)